MKFAYMIATEEVSDPHVTALTGRTEDLFGLVKAAGFTGAELMVRNPFEVDFGKIASLARKYGLDVPMLCSGEMFGEDGLSFADPDPAVRREAVERTKELMRAAGELGARVNVGRLRGRFRDDVPREETLRWMKDGFAEVSEADRNVSLLVEPINRNIANCILTTEDGLRFVRDLGIPNVKLMIDFMHMVVEGEDIAESVGAARGVCEHVHICDSDRKPLGKGTMDFSEFFAALGEIGYPFYVSVEAVPTDDYRDDLAEGFEILSRMAGGGPLGGNGK